MDYEIHISTRGSDPAGRPQGELRRILDRLSRLVECDWGGNDEFVLFDHANQLVGILKIRNEEK
jgi:hypothetical protein